MTRPPNPESHGQAFNADDTPHGPCASPGCPNEGYHVEGLCPGCAREHAIDHADYLDWLATHHKEAHK